MASNTGTAGDLENPPALEERRDVTAHAREVGLALGLGVDLLVLGGALRVIELHSSILPLMPALVLDSPHSGHDFPADFDAVVSERELRESEDCYVDELYAAAEEIGAPLVAARVPRTYIDANRHAGDVDLDLIEGPWPWEYRPSGKARIGKSLIWRTSRTDVRSTLAASCRRRCAGALSACISLTIAI